MNSPLLPLLFLLFTACMAAAVHYCFHYNEFLPYLHFLTCSGTLCESQSIILTHPAEVSLREEREISPDTAAWQQNITIYELHFNFFVSQIS